MARNVWHVLGYLYDGLFAIRPHRDLVAMVAQQHVRPGRRTIDFACGTGWLEAFATDDSAVIPVDFSPTMLARAKRRCSQRPVHGDVTQLPFAAEQFDTGIAINLLYAVPEDRQAQAVAEMARVLKPGGQLVLANPVSTDLVPLLQEHFRIATWRDHLRFVVNLPRIIAWVAVLQQRQPNFYFLPEPELLKLIEEHGFTVESSTPCYAGIDRLVVATKGLPT